MDTLSREYESGGSRPSYASLDRARNDRDALVGARNVAMDAVRSALWDLQQSKGGFSDQGRRDAISSINEIVDDLIWERYQSLKDEIEALEDALP